LDLRDDPQALEEYAEAHGADGRHWISAPTTSRLSALC
jgi:hypothetical protein